MGPLTEKATLCESPPNHLVHLDFGWKLFWGDFFILVDFDFQFTQATLFTGGEEGQTEPEKLV